MRDMLNEAAFGGVQPDQDEVDELTFEGKTLLMRAHQLGVAGSP